MKAMDKRNEPKWFASIMKLVNRCEADLLCRIPFLLILVCLVLMTITVGVWHTRILNFGAVPFCVLLVATLINLVKVWKAPDEEQEVPKWKPAMDLMEKVLFYAWIVAVVCFVLIKVF